MPIVVRVLLVFLFVGFQSETLKAQDAKAAAEQSATAFLNSLDSADPTQVFENFTATRAKAYSTKEAFVQWLNVFRIQAGGRAQSRLLVGSTPMAQLSNGDRGDFYYVRFRSAYPSSQAFTDLVLEHEGSKWLIVWFNVTPA